MKKIVFIFNDDSIVDNIPESFIVDDLNSLKRFLSKNKFTDIEFDDELASFNHPDLEFYDFGALGGGTYYELDYVN